MLASFGLALVVSVILMQVATFSTTIYLHRTATHKARLVGFVIFLAAFQIFGTFFFPLPTSDRAMAFTALFFYVVLAIVAWWVDRPQATSPS